MPGPFLPGLVRVTLNWTHDQHGDFSNVLHVDRGTLSSAEAAEAVLISVENMLTDPIDGVANTNLRPWLSQSTNFNGVSWQDLSVEDGAVGEGRAPTVLTRGSGTGVLPPDLAAVMSWRSGINGRKGRGRSYIGGLSSGCIDSATGLIRADFAEYLADLGNRFITRIGLEGALLVVYSRVLPGKMTTISSCTVDRNWDVQRRRGD